MACGDVLSLEDLQTAKKHQIFEAEVITGKAGGVAGGAAIDYATNQVTGQLQKTMPAILRDIGFEPASFDFTSGGTLTTSDRNKAVLWPIASGGDGDWYYWEGALPKVIPAASTPASTGGVAAGAWRPVGDLTLREELAAPVGSAMIGFQQDDIGAVPREAQSKMRERASLYDFGAIGDGLLHPLSDRFASLGAAQAVYPFVTSLTQSIDWAACQAAANSSHRKIQVTHGDFIINDGVVSNAHRKELSGEGGTIIAQNFTGNMLTFNGDYCAARHLELDGGGISRCGILFTGAGMKVHDCDLRDFFSSTTSAVAIEGNTHKGCLITDNTIDNVSAPPNGVIGDGPGAARAIELHASVAAIAGSLIDGNIISNILGEEGDAIQVLFYDGVSVPFLDSKTQISNNIITEFSRRGIKVQANNTDVVGNTLRVFGTYANPAFVINLVSSSNCTVKGNTVRSSFPCVSSSGGATYPNQNNSIIGNDFTILNNTASNSFNDFNSGLVYCKNTFTGGSGGLTSQNTENSEYSFNTFRGGPAGIGDAIRIFGGAGGRNVIKGNQNFGTWANGVNFTGAGNIVKDNFSLGLCIRTVAGNTDSIISGNTSSDGIAVFGDFTGQVLFDNQRMTGGVNGNNGTGVNRLFHSTADPTSLNPTKWYSKGDFAVNANPTPVDKILGWICTTSTTVSTPAVWRVVISV